MTCSPCKEQECLDVDEAEYEALTDLYDRLFDSCAACKDVDEDDVEEGCTCAESRSTAEKPGEPVKKGDVVGWCSTADGSALKRVDRELTEMLSRSQTDGSGGAAGGGSGGGSGGGGGSESVKHLSKLPVFGSGGATCSRKPGMVNATLFGLDIEQQMTTGVTSGGGGCGGGGGGGGAGGKGAGGAGRDDLVKRAAYDLAMAEAHCKHAGAVHAAELAVRVEPAVHLAEVAAHYGAQNFGSSTGSGTGPDAGGDTGDSPVVVLAYVGNTSATAEQ